MVAVPNSPRENRALSRPAASAAAAMAAEKVSLPLALRLLRSHTLCHTLRPSSCATGTRRRRQALAPSSLGPSTWPRSRLSRARRARGQSLRLRICLRRLCARAPTIGLPPPHRRSQGCLRASPCCTRNWPSPLPTRRWQPFARAGASRTIATCCPLARPRRSSRWQTSTPLGGRQISTARSGHRRTCANRPFPLKCPGGLVARARELRHKQRRGSLGGFG